MFIDTQKSTAVYFTFNYLFRWFLENHTDDWQVTSRVERSWRHTEWGLLLGGEDNNGSTVPCTNCLQVVSWSAPGAQWNRVNEDIQRSRPQSSQSLVHKSCEASAKSQQFLNFVWHFWQQRTVAELSHYSSFRPWHLTRQNLVSLCILCFVTGGHCLDLYSQALLKGDVLECVLWILN